MKNFILLLSLILLSGASTKVLAMDTIDELDLVKYSGDWHQIALIPNKFQKRCFANTMASYTVLPPNKKGVSHIEVNNSCFRENGEFKSGIGKARVNPKFDSSAKLQVAFAKILGKTLWFTAGNYWVLDIGDNYEYTVVGEPSREFAWILARSLSLPKAKLTEIRDLLMRQGYNPCDLIMSRNNKVSSKELPSLCEYVVD